MKNHQFIGRAQMNVTLIHEMKLKCLRKKKYDKWDLLK